MPQRTFNLADLFEIVAAAVPERTAIICGETQTSYAELDQRANALAAVLHAHGIQHGQSIGLHLYNGPEYLEGFLAACKLGAMPVNINYRYVADDLRHLYANARLKALIYSDALSGVVKPVLDEFPEILLTIASGEPYARLLAMDAPPPPRQRNDDDLMLLYTGGTTGLPKGVMWPHRALFFGALGGGGFYHPDGPVTHPQQLGERASQGPPLCYFAIAPLMHGAALWASLVSLLAGHTVLLHPQHEFDAEDIWETLARHRADIISIVGDGMGMPLLDALKAHPGRWDLSALKVLGSGGGMFSAHVQQALAAQLPGVRILDSMGSSESGVLGHGGRPESGDGFIKLAPRADIAVVSDDFTRRMGIGEEGFLARSGHVPVGYFGDPDSTARIFFELDGRRYVNTGDRARVDQDGGIIVLGRGSQCINSGGEKIHAEEVESVLRQHPKVRDAVVVGMPDPRWGQVVCALFSQRDGPPLQAAELRTFCRQSLAGYKIPKHLAQVSSIPRSPAGKADYRWAAEVMSGHLAGALKDTA